MVQDILTSLNTNGTGLDLSALTDDLVEAEIAPKRAIVERRMEATEASISALGRIRSEFDQLGGALDNLSGLSAMTLSGALSGLGAELSDPSRVRAAEHSIEVTQLAQGQVLDFAGFASADAEVRAGTLQIDFGRWAGGTFTADGARAPATISVAEGTTLRGLAERIGEVEGLSASVVKVSEGDFSLTVRGAEGADNAIRIAASPTGTTGADLARFDTTADNAQQVQAAQDARLRFDGLEVARASNRIGDLIDGVTLTLNRVSDGPQTLRVGPDADAAFDVLQGFVEQINTVRATISEAARTGVAGGDPGALAGDQAAKAALRALEDVTSTALDGFGGPPVRLAEFGVATRRDGSLALDRDRFDRAFEADPKRFDALFTDRLAASDRSVGTSLGRGDAMVPGSYTFTRDPATGTAQLGATTLEGRALDDGRVFYAIRSGPLDGAGLVVEPDLTRTELTYGRSLVSELSRAVDAVTGQSGAIGLRERALQDSMSEDSARLDALDTRAATLEERYTSRFTAMEQVVAEINSTADYLENLVAAWNQDG